MRNLFVLILFSIVTSFAYGAGCESATDVEVGTSCSFKKYTLSSGVGKLGKQDCGWTEDKYKEVWLKAVMPASGRMVVDTEGSYIDGFIAIYTGSCGNLSTYKCSSNGRLPETIDVTGIKPGETVYIRVSMMYENSVGVCVYSQELTEKPECSPMTMAADVCSKATLIQTPNGYCGNTSGSYSPEKPGNLQNVFCGSIENNSWIQFVAAESDAQLNIFISNCKLGVGVQMRIYETDDCLHFTPKSNCWNPAIETNGTVKATDLVRGRRYYLMIDGYAGDVCDYTISAGKGVETPQTYLEESICKGERYTKNGFNVSEPGVYRREIPTSKGVDSLVVLNLSVKEPSNTYLSATIYKCERYTENGFNVNTAGKHYLKLTNVNSCDSIVELDLSVLPQKETYINASICAGDVYRQHGFNASKAGDYTQKMKSVAGCDSIVNLHLEVNGAADLKAEGITEICSGTGGTTMIASGGNNYIWLDASGHKIGEGDYIHLDPSVTSSYVLRSVAVKDCPSSVSDCEGYSYPVVRIGNQCWTAENMRSKTYDTESEKPGVKLGLKPAYYGTDYCFGPYYYDPKNATSQYSANMTSSDRTKVGLLYSWAAACGYSEIEYYNVPTNVERQGICPNGWHVPSSKEYVELCTTVGGEAVVGVKLRAKSGWYKGSGATYGTDDYGFAWLPSGFSDGSKSYYIGGNGTLWSSTPEKQKSDNAWDMYTFFSSYDATKTCYEKFYARAVRCVKRVD